MAKKKSLSLTTLILLALAAVGLILTIVGVCTDWIKYSVKSIAGTVEEGASLKELSDGSFEMFGAMNAFAYITMILAIVSVAASVLSKFLKIGLLKPIAAIAGLLTVLSTILLIVFTCMFCSKNGSLDLGELGSMGFKWAVGSILAVVGGFLSGLCSLAMYKY